MTFREQNPAPEPSDLVTDGSAPHRPGAVTRGASGLPASYLVDDCRYSPRRLLAAGMRLAGASLKDIGAALDISVDQASKFARNVPCPVNHVAKVNQARALMAQYQPNYARWCPPEYRELYLYLRKKRKLRGDDARRLIEDHIQIIERRKHAALTTNPSPNKSTVNHR